MTPQVRTRICGSKTNGAWLAYCKQGHVPVIRGAPNRGSPQSLTGRGRAVHSLGVCDVVL